jgi:hypothetical protein
MFRIVGSNDSGYRAMAVDPSQTSGDMENTTDEANKTF